MHVTLNTITSVVSAKYCGLMKTLHWLRILCKYLVFSLVLNIVLKTLEGYDVGHNILIGWKVR